MFLSEERRQKYSEWEGISRILRQELSELRDQEKKLDQAYDQHAWDLVEGRIDATKRFCTDDEPNNFIQRISQKGNFGCEVSATL